MALGYILVVPMLLLLGSARITATTKFATSSPQSVATSQPRTSTAVPETTGGIETTIPMETTFPSSVSLLPDTTGSWNTHDETSRPGGATTVFSASSPEGSWAPPQTTTEFATSSPSSVLTSQPLPSTPVSETTGGMEITTPAETTRPFPSSVALLSDTTGPWNTREETSHPGGATTLPSSSSPEGSRAPPQTTTEFAISSPSSVPTSQPRTSTPMSDTTGGMETTTPAKTTFLSSVSLFTDTTGPWSTREEISRPGGATTLPSSSSPEGSRAPPQNTTEFATSSLSSVPTSQPRTSTPVSETTGGMETTTPAETTFTSSVALLSDTTGPWSTHEETSHPGGATTLPSSSSPEGSPVPPQTTTEFATSSLSSVLTSQPRTSTSMSDTTGGMETTTPAETTFPSSVSLLSDTTGPWNTREETSHPGGATTLPSSSSPEGSRAPPQTTTEFTTSSPSNVPTSQPHPSTPVSDITGGKESTTPAETTFPSSVSLLADTSGPWSTREETSRPGGATTLLSSSSPEGSTSAGTQDVFVASPSFPEMTSLFSNPLGAPSDAGMTLPSESTGFLLSSTTQGMNSTPHSPAHRDERTSEGLSSTINTTSQAEFTCEKYASSLPLATETIIISPSSVALLTSVLFPRSTSGVGDGSVYSEGTSDSPAEITSRRSGSSLSSTSSSVTQDGSTPKSATTGLLSSNPGRSSMGLSPPSSRNPTSQSPTTTLKVLSSTVTSLSASKGLPKTPGKHPLVLMVQPPSLRKCFLDAKAQKETPATRGRIFRDPFLLLLILRSRPDRLPKGPCTGHPLRFLPCLEHI